MRQNSYGTVSKSIRGVQHPTVQLLVVFSPVLWNSDAPLSWKWGLEIFIHTTKYQWLWTTWNLKTILRAENPQTGKLARKTVYFCSARGIRGLTLEVRYYAWWIWTGGWCWCCHRIQGPWGARGCCITRCTTSLEVPDTGQVSIQPICNGSQKCRLCLWLPTCKELTFLHDSFF